MELATDLTPDGLRDVLAELSERVAPTTLARDRLLGVHPAFSSLFPEGGLVRGRVHGCAGPGATTTTMALARDALLDGGWMALVDVTTFGADAANELGVPLERVVRIESRPMEADGAPGGPSASGVSGAAADERRELHARRWVEVTAAAIDGFDLVVACVPPALRGDRVPASVRALLARLQQRGSVLFLLGSTGAIPVDLTIAVTGSWTGLGRGHGVIRGRRLDLVVSGRRQPRPTRCAVELTAEGSRVRISSAPERSVALVPVGHVEREEAGRVGSVEVVDPGGSDASADGGDPGDPGEVVLAEMVAHDVAAGGDRVDGDTMHLAAG